MSALLDEETIAELLEMVEDMPELLTEIIDAYLEQGVELLAALERSITEKDATGLREAAHSLKGASYNVGAVPLAEITSILEQKGANADWQGVDESFSELKSCYQESIVAIQALNDNL